MNYRNDVTDCLMDTLLRFENREDLYRFFEDACTVKELLDIAQRLQVARMLDEKRSYAAITKETGMSTATISRVNRCLMYGSGGYRMAIDGMKKEPKA
ncbi:MAG: hypothetical protein IJW83_01445 [Clostridia bacterium]|nr:hypothetical protein [Clostridia bacterium]